MKSGKLLNSKRNITPIERVDNKLNHHDFFQELNLGHGDESCISAIILPF
jgi:hypothetical protein